MNTQTHSTQERTLSVTAALSPNRLWLNSSLERFNFMEEQTASKGGRAMGRETEKNGRKRVDRKGDSIKNGMRKS